MFFAHAGHWLVQFIYLLPIALVVVLAIVGRSRERAPKATDRDGVGG